MCKCGRKRDFGTTTRREKKVCKTAVALVSHTKESQKDLIATLRGGGTYVSTLGVLVGKYANKMY